MEIALPYRKHNSTKERQAPLRLIVHLVAQPVGALTHLSGQMTGPGQGSRRYLLSPYP